MSFTLDKSEIPEGIEKRESHLYGIVGVLSQPGTIGEGVAAFGGYFRHDLETGNVCDGQLVDFWGQSEIVNFGFMGETALSFSKRYLNRRDFINYEFNKDENGLWIGTYSGAAVGEGKAQAKTNLIDDDAFSILCGIPRRS